MGCPDRGRYIAERERKRGTAIEPIAETEANVNDLIAKPSATTGYSSSDSMPPSRYHRSGAAF